METIFLAVTGAIVFAAAAVSVILWKALPFLNTGPIDFRFAMLIGVALVAKMAFDRAKAVLKQHTD